MEDNRNENVQNVQTEENLSEILQIRRDKLADLQNAGKDPFVITKYDGLDRRQTYEPPYNGKGVLRSY